MHLFRKILPPLFIAVGAISLLIFSLRPQATAAQIDPQTKISAELAQQLEDSDDPIRFIIYMTDQLDLDFDRLPEAELSRREAIVNSLQSTARKSQRQILPQLELMQTQNRIRRVQPFWITNAIAAEGDADTILTLAKHPAVGKIDLNHQNTMIRPIDIQEAEVGDANPETWGLERVKAPQAWHALGITGTGVTVAIMDTGVDYLHPDLASNYRGLQNNGDYNHLDNWFHAAYPTITVPFDQQGHGTHVAGTAVGQNGIGVAPGANWISIAIGDEANLILNSYIYAAFEWMLAPNGDASLAPDIINGSWGGPGDQVWFIKEIDLLKEAGIIPVFSAGNQGPMSYTVDAPAAYPNMISVGATESEDQVVWFSARGPSILHDNPAPLIAAPGTKIYSSLPDNEYGYYSGTSMASPHVAGALALLLSTDHDLVGYSDVRNHLIDSAEPFQDSHPNMESGHGMLNTVRLIEKYIPNSGQFSGIVQSDGSPVPGIDIQVSAPSGNFVIQTDQNGQYSFYAKPGNYLLTVDTFGYHQFESGNLTLSTDKSFFNINLDKVAHGTLEGRVASLDGSPIQAPVRITSFEFETVIETDAFGNYSIKLPTGYYAIHVAKSGYTLGKDNGWVNEDTITDRSFSLDESESILMVDAGQWSFRGRAEEYIDAFSLLDKGYDLHSIYDPVADLPTLEDLKAYDIVIWSDPRYAPGYIGASITISQYMSAGGNMLLTGSRLALYDSSSLADVEWPSLIAHAEPLALITPTQAIFGRDNTEFRGQNISLKSDKKGTNNVITTMKSKYPYKSEIIFDHGPTIEEENGVGIKSGHCEQYNIVYLGFEISDLEDTRDQADILNSSIEWMNHAPQEAGVQWLAEDSESPVVPGQTYGYQVKLYNRSETMTVTYDINIEGEWPVEIISPTLTLGPCEALPTTISVTVPADLGKNVSDSTLITAISQNNEQIRDDLTISHKTPGTVLLVDGHRWYPQTDIYEAEFEKLDLNYDVWTMRGDLQRGSPPAELLQEYRYVVWYTAYDWFAPGTKDEVESLELYLENGGRLFMNSQDFLYYNDQTKLARGYFGITDFHESITPTVVFGDELFSVPAALTGSLPIYFDDFQNNGDTMLLSDQPNVRPLLWHDRGIGGVGNFSDDPDTPWRTVFWGVPFETLADDAHNDVMAGALGWLGDLGDTSIEVDQSYVDPGNPLTFTVTIRNRPTGITQTVTITNPLPAGLEYITGTLVGDATWDPTAQTFSWVGSLAPNQSETFSYQASPQSAGRYLNQIQIAGDQELVPFSRGAIIQAGGFDLSTSEIHHELGPRTDGSRRVTMTLAVNNVGDTPISNITATAFIPEEMVFLTDTVSSLDGTAVYTQASVIWHGDVAAASQVTVSAVFTSDSAYLDEWILSNLRIEDAEAPKWFIYEPQFFEAFKNWAPFVGQD